MAASVYATPPPDLSGEEAALSDASNSSQTNSSHGSTLKASKRTLSSSFLNAAITQSSTPTTTSQLSSDSLPDLSKKRRKQSMPIRFSANGTAIDVPPSAPDSEPATDADDRSVDGVRGDGEAPQEDASERGRAMGGGSPSNPASPAQEASDNEGAALLEEQQNNFQKIFLSNLSQLQQKHLQLQQHSDGFLPLGNPESFLSSKLNSLMGALSSSRAEGGAPKSDDDENETDEATGRARSADSDDDNVSKGREPRTPGSGWENGNDHSESDEMKQREFGKDCDGMDRATFKPAGDHPPSSDQTAHSASSPPRISMKKELFMDPEWDGEIRSNLPKPEDWISIAGLSFPFPPEAAAALSASGYLPQLPPLLGVPSVSSFGGSADGGSRTSVPPLRIFNPEAYCDLCNKEFCNKYFLKTHKANKHGIYEPAANNGSSDNSSSALSAMANPFNSIHQLSQVFQMQQQQPHPSGPAAAEQLEKHSTGPGLGQHSAVPDANQQLLSQPHHLQQQSGAAGQQAPGGAGKQPTQPPMRSTQSPKVPTPGHIQPTVFCDICFKKFSSLSAMRKHRSKAHELSNSNHQLQQQLQQHHQQQLQQQQHQLQQQLQQHLQQQHQQYQQQLQVHHLGADGSKQEATDGGAGGGGGTDGPPSGPLQLPDGFREDYTVEQEDATFTPQPRKLSPHSMQAAKEANFSADKLKRLGVSNPEAFCEICCKEYCNKYFLRTHRLKRHGIFPTPDEMKEERNPWAPFMQTSPLNLIMGGTAADMVSAQMALQASSPSSLKKFLTAGELAHGGDGAAASIEGAKGSAVEIKQEHPFSSKTGRGQQMANGDGRMADGADFDEQAQSDASAGHTADGEDKQQQQQQQQQHGKDPVSDEDAEAISVDLQKLQSMIMQLNDLNSIQHHRKMSCGVCGKELPNQYLLHAHMIQEHGALSVDNNNGQKGSREPTPHTASLTGPAEMVEVCKHCDKEFSNVYMLKQHLLEAHSLQGIPSPKREGFVTPERPAAGSGAAAGGIPMPPAAAGYGERKPPFSMTPTSSYCEICNKELCNKYFMKTHMQRMHGIEIENGAQIGGVVCNICNKELCSKYFLRVHKHNTHGIVEEGAPLPQARQNGSGGGGSGGGGGAAGSGAAGGGGGGGGDAGTLAAVVAAVAAGENGDGGGSYPGGDPAALLKPGEISDLSNRYYSHFTEVCPLCSRRFRSAKWLRAHLLSDHGKTGIEKLKDIEQKLANGPAALIGTGSNGAGLGGGGNGRSKSNSPSLKVPNGLNEAKYGAKSPFGGLSPAEAAKFLPKGGAIPPGLFGPEQPTSPIGGIKGYQCSYCSFATPLLPLLFIHERSHSSLSIVQQQLLQQQQQQQHQQQQQQEEAQASILGVASFAPLLKSESAVSLAKHQSTNQMIPGSSSETPSSTPASTPVPSLSQEALNLHQRPQTQSPVARAGSSGFEEPVGSPPALNPASRTEVSCSKPTSPKPGSPPTAGEPTAMLSEMANITQRPAVYALPQQSGPLMMQSFLIEESLSGASSGGGGGGGGRSPKDSDKPEGLGSAGHDHRFVPAVVFLPVKERILTPMTISFNLSPA